MTNHSQSNHQEVVTRCMQALCDAALFESHEIEFPDFTLPRNIQVGDEISVPVLIAGVDTSTGVGAELFRQLIHAPLVLASVNQHDGKYCFKVAQRVVVIFVTEYLYVCWSTVEEVPKAWISYRQRMRAHWTEHDPDSHTPPFREHKKTPMYFTGDLGGYVPVHPEVAR